MKTEYMNIAILILTTCTCFVAFSQMRIASAKTRLDLYNKRFAIYLAALEYYQALWREHSEESVKSIKEKAECFTKAYRESQFLFDAESGVYEILGELQQHGSTMSYYIKRRVECDVQNLEDRSDLLALLAAYNESYPHFEMKLKSLELKMKRYLNFSKIDGWRLV
ncbi:hypothetical protein ACK3ZC_08225 [Aeromonas caviae]|uniref:hypothetical protein n=1 Tax=Aeromonas caviae TaxID=648 RepID=UPI00191D6FB3|nr:hypothetical protein [Aeromonas caviae]MBL0509854.1 hypothetical protein [Aeromonas caviae]